MHRHTCIDFDCLSWNLHEYLETRKRRESYDCIFAIISDFYGQNESRDKIISFQGVSDETYAILKQRLVNAYDTSVVFHFTPHRDQDELPESTTVFGNVVVLLIQAGRSPIGGMIEKVNCDSYDLSDPNCALASLRIWTADKTLIEIIGIHLSPNNATHTLQLERVIHESTSDILVIAGVTNSHSFSTCEGQSPLSFPSTKPTRAVSDIWVRGRAVQHQTEILRILFIEEISDYLPIMRRIENVSCKPHTDNGCIII